MRILVLFSGGVALGLLAQATPASTPAPSAASSDPTWQALTSNVTQSGAVILDLDSRSYSLDSKKFPMNTRAISLKGISAVHVSILNFNPFRMKAQFALGPVSDPSLRILWKSLQGLGSDALLDMSSDAPDQDLGEGSEDTLDSLDMTRASNEAFPDLLSKMAFCLKKQALNASNPDDFKRVLSFARKYQTLSATLKGLLDSYAAALKSLTVSEVLGLMRQEGPVQAASPDKTGAQSIQERLEVHYHQARRQLLAMASHYRDAVASGKHQPGAASPVQEAEAAFNAYLDFAKRSVQADSKALAEFTTLLSSMASISEPLSKASNWDRQDDSRWSYPGAHTGQAVDLPNGGSLLLKANFQVKSLPDLKDSGPQSWSTAIRSQFHLLPELGVGLYATDLSVRAAKVQVDSAGTATLQTTTTKPASLNPALMLNFVINPGVPSGWAYPLVQVGISTVQDKIGVLLGAGWRFHHFAISVGELYTQLEEVDPAKAEVAPTLVGDPVSNASTQRGQWSFYLAIQRTFSLGF